jgi:hypothetical protein
MSIHTAMIKENLDQREGQPEPNSAGGTGGGAVLDATPCSASSEPLHVYDWLELPPSDDAEKAAKEWLDKFTLPAYTKHTEGINDWLARYRVTVEWKGKRYTCSGASRMGDVWLKTEGSANYYDHRVNVEELSNWKRISLPNEKSPGAGATE